MKIHKVSLSQRARMVAVVAGLVTVSALIAPTAVAAESAPKPGAAQLAQVSDAVLDADISGTAWYTDAKSGKVVVTADSTVSAAEIDRIKKQAGAESGALKINRTPGTFSKMIAGGEAIYTAGARCTLGFNVVRAGVFYALTAGHCTNIGPSWTTAVGPLGNRFASVFPGSDHGVIQHAIPANADGRVYLHNGTYRDMVNASTPLIGQFVERSGSTTGYHTGRVTGLNATVNYGGGQLVYGLIQTNVCGQPGDSGGPLFSGNTAHGLLSGGSGNCTVGGTTFYEPVLRPLTQYGLTIF
ncbi:S1 family peptidase [Streptomyces clavuligerus]|uniref:Serine protease 2 n=2 Tax=Streptomyces clavuligerus TaxID=1901 RepID=B5GZ73_STRCL|nr:S1 family peptidase [Streptomyces clavuligerus]ANW20439.1 streptogrisin [Streptomyces clavuligerus]AXU15065.1 S1 family peptidase [Streptomyces clavuligerus]EDY51619.1 streptogrisin-A [Streptomyces clavuligerus]EFG06589.1 Serine protease 2 [Streptomyces clavuligerus]MBY6305124.1 S1 family peptidase [Streptomyces clavuligerus]